MSSLSQQFMTANDFWRLPETGRKRELIRGEVVETMPPGGRHGGIAAQMASLLILWNKSSKSGHVGVESGYQIAHDPDTVFGPDVSFVRSDRIPASGVPDAFWDLAPDVAVEVISASESAGEVREKIGDYLAAGTCAVVAVYPKTREVVVHTPDGLARTFGPNDTLALPEILAGFTCSVAELFE